MKILAIETSCDETAAAVVEDGTKILSNVVASSSDMHEKWGGIVPEVAAREQLKSIIPVIMEALSPFQTHNPQPTTHNQIPYKPIIEKNIDAIAVTVGPGLVGSLLIGVECAKTIAFVTGKPIIPVNHVLAHMYANMVDSSEFIVRSQKEYNVHVPSSPNHEPRTTNHSLITFPAISLVVSGGHTELFLMKSMKDLKWLGGTIDDAAGEAFDKTARLLGFGSRGGLAIQEAASQFKISNLKFKIGLPRPLLHDHTLNFSFSGLKTAILREVNKLDLGNQKSEIRNQLIQQLAFETQEAITDVLVAKTMKAAELYDAKSILISGGVASNLRLREKFNLQLTTNNLQPSFHCPPISLCTDNAAYIASYAYFRSKPVDWHTIDVAPDLSVEV